MTVRLSRRAAWMGALFLATCAGCTRPLPFNDNVQGLVKLDGKPLTGVSVAFVPDFEPGIKVPGSSGFTDDEGRFALTRDGGPAGAVVGKHRVVIVRGREAVAFLGERPDPNAAPVAKRDKRPIPKVYMDATRSPVVVDVTPDKHTYDIDLSSSGSGS